MNPLNPHESQDGRAPLPSGGSSSVPVDRVMEALDFAATLAETGEGCTPVQRVTTEEFQEASKLHPVDVRRYLDRVMMGTDPEGGLDGLLEVGVLEAIFPEVHALVGFGDGEWRHKDVWKHTKQVVRQAAPRVEVRWGALFHDVGKVKTRAFTKDGKVQFLGHAEVGARMFDKLNRRMPLFVHEPALLDTVRFLVLHHLRPNQYDPEWTDSAVRRFARELGLHLNDLLCLARADITTKRPEKKRRGLDQIDELQARITALAAEDAVQPPLPTGVGDAMMKAFSIPPSRLIGDVKKALEKMIESGEIEPHRESEYYIEIVAKDRARFSVPG